MPMKSKAQSRMMHGIASGDMPPPKGGPSKAVAKRFVADSKGQTQKNLPQRKTKP